MSGAPVDPDQKAIERIAQAVARSTGHPAARVAEILHIAAVRRTTHLCDYLLRIEGGGATVRSGPFAGMTYLPQTFGSFLPPKLLGCYEAELHDVIERIVAKGYPTVVNIGCGEGYYTVGLARRMPAGRVYAFDLAPEAQAMCRQLAEVNGVADRVVLAGECGVSELRELARAGTLILCDCEGAEATLLDPAAAPGLAGCDILVELHDFRDPTLSQRVPARFAATHDVQRIDHGGRDPNALPALRGLHQLDQLLAVYEGRPGPTPWAFMTAR
jgi:hypothetical protein